MLHSGSHNVVMLNVAMLSGYAECHYSEHCYAECRYTCIVMLSAVFMVVCMQNFVMLCFGIVMLIVFMKNFLILITVILFASLHNFVVMRALYWS